jgi:hypothetical protein
MTSSRLLTIVEWILLAALVGVFVVSGFLPAWRTMNTDFPNYFVAASIHRQGISLDRAYEWRWFQRQKDYLQVDQPLVGFAPHPPMCAVPMLPLAKLPSLKAKRIWLVLNLVFLALAVWILRQATSLSLRRILLLTFLCILPLRENFLYGQYYVLILLLLCAAYYAACRGRRFTCGAVLAVAASLKIFPALFLILFLRKRNWRAAAGLVGTSVVLAGISVLLFGWSVHKVYLLEILPRALHGDLVGPYVLQWNSFTALCHRFFLAEPEMNAAPWINSPMLYSMVQALLASLLLLSFLLSTGDEDSPAARAWEWSTFLPVLILWSSMPTAYHHCVLILSAALAIDILLKDGRYRTAIAVAIAFTVACFPQPALAWLNSQGRLAGDLLLYLILLSAAPARATWRTRRVGVALAAVFFGVLTASNLRGLHHRSEDFSQRLPTPSFGYAAFSVNSAGPGLLLDEMVADSYSAIFLPAAATQQAHAFRARVPGDVLSIAASPQSPFVYLEVANQNSRIFRVPLADLSNPAAAPEFVADGHDPAISPDGHWLVFLRDENGKTVIWMSGDARSNQVPVPALLPGTSNLGEIMEMSVANNGDLIAAVGTAADPHFILRKQSGEIRALAELRGAVRYPAISNDGEWLAFSRRESGTWHLFARELKSGREQRLTSASCNATAPAWEDPQTLLYISDCGRGLALGAPARVTFPSKDFTNFDQNLQ